MKKIIPFKKDIIFKTNISEITSISLENTLSKNGDNNIRGDFTISGEYKVADESIHIEQFSYDLPFDINMDDKYNLSNCIIDIDDFYYEIINSNVLSINIDVLIDKIEENILEKLDNVEEERIMPLQKEEQIIDEERCIEPEDLLEEVNIKREELPIPSEISSVFDTIDSYKETYKSYKVYIVREGDDLEYILEKYATTKEIMDQYNDLKELKPGDKIIIPSQNEII